VETQLPPISKAEQALAYAKTPEESRQVEAMAAAAKAWAKEQNDFEGVVEASEIYILAKRKTTELIEPEIRQGQYGREKDNDVNFIKDYGFTHKQWTRRKQELKATLDDIESYIVECIEKHTEPTSYGLVRYCTTPHVAFNSGNNEWDTPPEYIEAARQVMGDIDLDPATTELANLRVKAKHIYTAEDDGLEQDWFGRVWMNPPYSQPLITKFAEKMAASYAAGEIEQACVLVNNATETHWFQIMLIRAAAVCFIRGRIKFLDEDGNPSGAPLQGQTILYLGGNVQEFTKYFERFGVVLYAHQQER